MEALLQVKSYSKFYAGLMGESESKGGFDKNFGRYLEIGQRFILGFSHCSTISID